MPSISLTSLVDFVSKAGAPKQTCAAKIKAQLAAGYDPARDYYRGIREAIIETHQEGMGKSHITTAVQSASPRRYSTYEELARDYISWWGRKRVTWFDPPRAGWEAGHGFEVRVNPEMGLKINGDRHVIKLYFKPEKLAKQRVEIITHLMHHELAGELPAGTRFSVLDIRSRKLHTIVPPTYWGPLLMAEIAYLAALWPHV